MMEDKQQLNFINSLQEQPPEVFCKKGVLKNFVTFTEKRLCHDLFFQKRHTKLD